MPIDRDLNDVRRLEQAIDRVFEDPKDEERFERMVEEFRRLHATRRRR